jgi:hypothetical protein
VFDGRVGVRRDLLVDCAERLRRAVSACANVSSDQLTYARHFEGVEKAEIAV